MNRNLGTKFCSLFVAVLATLMVPRCLPAQGTFVYTNDNDNPNMVAALSVGSDGALTFLGLFSTGGAGLYGSAGFNRVVAGPVGDFLYAADIGSNDVAVFAIDPATGNLTPVPGSPFKTANGGGTDISLAVTPDNKFLFAENDSNEITAFSIASDGSLVIVGGSPFSTNGVPQGMKVSPDGKFLAVAVLATSMGYNGIDMFSIGAEGVLTLVPGSPFKSLAGFDGPQSVDINCAANMLFIGDASGATSVEVDTIAPNGALSPVAGSPFWFSSGQNSCDVVLSPNDQLLFVSNAFSDSVTVLSVASNGSLSLVTGSPFAANIGGWPGGLATDQAGTLLYVASTSFWVSTAGNIAAFSIAGGGALTAVAGSPFSTQDTKGFPTTLAVFPPKICPPMADLSPTSLTFGNQLLSTMSVPQSVTVTNPGSTLSITSIMLSGTNASDFALTSPAGACPASITLSPGASCTLNVTFTPSATGARNASLTIASNALVPIPAISLTGTGVQPLAALSSSSLNFGNQAVSTTSATQTLTLSNSGAAALTITSVAVTGDYSQTNNCGSSVNAGAICTITLSFKPTAMGTSSGTLTVTDNSGDESGSTQIASLSGTGLAPVAALAPASLNFSGQEVGTTSTGQTLTLSNTGNAALTVTGVTVTGDYGQTNNCGATLAAGSICVITVTFKPSAIGSRAGTLTVTDNSFSGSTQTASLSGTGTAPAASLSPATLSFGDQDLDTSSTARSLTLTNTGTAALTISGVTATGDFTETNTCGASLAAGASCTISLIFKPTAAGLLSGIVVVTDNSNAIAGTTQTSDLTGTGMGSWGTTSVPAVSFPSQMATTSSKAQTFTLTNTGNMTLTITGYAMSGANPGDFVETHTCGSTLAPEASCTISVSFDPTAGGMRSAMLVITDNSPTSPHDIALSGMGQDFTLSITPSVTIPAGRKAVYDLWLTPQGGFDQTVSVTCSGAPSEATCAVWPAAIKSWNGKTAVAVSIDVSTTARPAITPPRFAFRIPPRSPFGVATPLDPAAGRILYLAAIGLAVLGLMARKRKRALGLAALSLTLSVMMWSSCGSGAVSQIQTLTTPAGTPAGRYTLTLTTTSATLTHTVSATLIVQ